MVSYLIFKMWARDTTFIWTMFDDVCCCSTKNNFNFFVLDRPNPLGGETVRGPMLQSRIHIGSQEGYGIPAVHGMTVGELEIALMKRQWQLVTLHLQILFKW